MNWRISASTKDWELERLSIPAAGRTIFSSARRWIEPLSLVFGTLVKNALVKNRQIDLWQRYRKTFFPVVPSLDMMPIAPETELKLCISAILCEWMLCRAANPDIKTISFEDAECWFVGDTKGFVPGLLLSETDWIPPECTKELEDLSFDVNFLNLLPYILELFDNVTTNGSIPDKQSLRAMKRRMGVVYTPTDLADFIIGQTLGHHRKAFPIEMAEGTFAVLDPACGTGIFLRSALDAMKKTWGTKHSTWDLVKCLYGMDVSPQAIQSCSFILVGHCLNDLKQEGLSPWRIWQAIRGNLAVVDSTLVVRDQTRSDDSFSKARLRAQIRAELTMSSTSENLESLHKRNTAASESRHSSYLSSTCLEPTVGKPSKLEDSFPERSDGFSVVIGNPPYSRLPWDSYTGVRAANFRTAPSSPNKKSSSCYPLFVEMMWQQTGSKLSSAGMVVPLSIAYGSSPSIRHLRKAIEEKPGTWRFAFFDRTPDSLFGDSVKTRNAVVLWSKDLNTDVHNILTGPLLRWNSRNRKTLFNQIDYTPLIGISIHEFIPKLGSDFEVGLYYQVRKENNKLSSLYGQAHNAGVFERRDGKLVFYNSTAYNWIPIFRVLSDSFDHNLRQDMRPSLRALDCIDEKYAWFVFACLVSRIAYWLWRVEGDGFHVTKEFIDRLPFHPYALSEHSFEQLVFLAERMWIGMLKHPVESINKGKRTVSYYPYACEHELDTIDSILLGSHGLPNNCVSFLKRFVMENIVAGRYDEIQTNPALRRLGNKESQRG